MRILAILLLSCLVSNAATVRFALTNFYASSATNAHITVTPTNGFVVNHPWLQVGKPIRILNPSGVVTTNLLTGTYVLTIADQKNSTPAPLVFGVPNDTNTYDITELLTNGFSAQITGPPFSLYWPIAGLRPGNHTTYRTESGVTYIDTEGADGGQATNILVSKAGTNISILTNGLELTISGQPRVYVTGSGATTVATNGSTYTVSSTDTTGHYIAAGTNVTAVTNGSLVTLSATANGTANGFTNGNTLWVDPNGSDTTAVKGRSDLPYKTISAAATAAGVGDTINVHAGFYNVSNSIYVPVNGALNIAAGAWITNWIALTNGGTAITLADNCSVVNDGAVIDGRLGMNDGIYQAGIGMRRLGLTGGFTNATVFGGTLYGDTDCFYVNSTNACSVSIQSTHAISRWDALALFNGAHNVTLHNCKWESVGGSKISAQVGSPSCVKIGDSSEAIVVSGFGGSITCSNVGGAYPVITRSGNAVLNLNGVYLGTTNDYKILIDWSGWEDSSKTVVNLINCNFGTNAVNNSVNGVTDEPCGTVTSYPVLTVSGGGGSTNSFNTNQFSVSGGNVTFKSGAATTNLTVINANSNALVFSGLTLNLSDMGGKKVLDWNLKKFFNQYDELADAEALNWNTFTLKSPDRTENFEDVSSINWSNRTLYSSSGAYVADWYSGFLRGNGSGLTNIPFSGLATIPLTNGLAANTNHALWIGANATNQVDYVSNILATARINATNDLNASLRLVVTNHGTVVSNGAVAFAVGATNGTVAKAVSASNATNYFGQLSPTNFNSGTSASTTTWLRGDGTWVAPSGTGDAVKANNNDWSGSNYFGGSTRFGGGVYGVDKLATNTATDGQVLSVTGDRGKWIASGGSPTSTRGDMIVRGESSDIRLPLGIYGSFPASDGTDIIVQSPRQCISIIDEWTRVGTYNYGQLMWSPVASGTGASANTDNNAETDAFGILRQTTGTTETGSHHMHSGTLGILLGASTVYYESRVRLATLSDGTDTYEVRAGLANSATAGEWSMAVGFRYCSSTNSGKWEAFCAESGTQYLLNTGLTPSAATWVKLSFLVNSGATSVTFYTNGVSAGTISSGIPKTFASRNISPCKTIRKWKGTTARTLETDYDYLWVKFNSEK